MFTLHHKLSGIKLSLFLLQQTGNVFVAFMIDEDSITDEVDVEPRTSDEEDDINKN